MNKVFAIFHVMLILGVLHGCSVNPVTGEQDLVLMSEDQELALGREYHAQILKEYGEYEDAELTRYIQRVGEKVANQSHRSNLIYRFTILDSPDVNAFALPGGYIYITRGILAYLDSEAELAAVLGHEIGHVTARHAVRQHSTATLAGIAGAILASASGVQGAGNLANLLSTALVRGYGREHELEADRLGAEYLSKTGYRAEAMLDVVRLLKNQEIFEKELAKLEDREPRIYHGLFSTHPDNDERLKSVIRASKNNDVISKSLSTDDRRSAYLKAIDMLNFAEDPKEGVLRGQRFYHAALDFSLEFPEGWRVKNKPDRLVAYSPKNDGYMVFTVQDRNRRIDPEQFLRQRMKLEDLRSGESFMHEGMQGFTAIAETSSEYGTRPARFVVIYHDNRAFVIAGVAKPDKRPYQYDNEFLRTGKSFRRLSKEEKILSQPHHLRVVTYQGQGYAELAKKSGLNHLAESQLRLLNKHYPKGEPAKGSLIKIVE